MGARGTPAFFINGKYMKGAKPFPAFKVEIEAALAEADAEIAKGTPLKNIHRVLALKHGGQAYVDAVIDGKKPSAVAKKPRGEPTAPVGPVDVPVSPEDPSKGPDDAPITIVAFSDFQCPYCSRVNPSLESLMKEYKGKIRVVFKHQPLSFHKRARPAAIASLAAHEQGKFWEYHDLVFANAKKLSDEDLLDYAKQLKLKMKKFKKDLASDKLAKMVDRHQAEAAKVGARGTPTSFINGVMIKGAQPVDNWKKVVDSELAKLKK